MYANSELFHNKSKLEKFVAALLFKTVYELLLDLVFLGNETVSVIRNLIGNNYSSTFYHANYLL